jgi:hypothetical protein
LHHYYRRTVLDDTGLLVLVHSKIKEQYQSKPRMAGLTEAEEGHFTNLYCIIGKSILFIVFLKLHGSSS